MATHKHENIRPVCLCGCDGTTKGGRYLPGHDAKHKSALITDALAGGKRAEKKLEAFGWTKFLEAAREKVASEEAQPERKRRRATGAPELVAEES